MNNCPASLLGSKFYGLGLVWFGEFNPVGITLNLTAHKSPTTAMQLIHDHSQVQIPFTAPRDGMSASLNPVLFFEGHED